VPDPNELGDTKGLMPCSRLEGCTELSHFWLQRSSQGCKVSDLTLKAAKNQAGGVRFTAEQPTFKAFKGLNLLVTFSFTWL
jgi:hypothetical protein